MVPFILPFDSTEAILAVVGGKGSNPSRPWRAGFPVLPGFLITIAAYNAFVHANGFQDQTLALAINGATETGEASAAIRRLFERGSVQTEQAVAIWSCPTFVDTLNRTSVRVSGGIQMMGESK